MDQTVRKSRVRDTVYGFGRRITYEVPDKDHEHDPTLHSFDRGVEVFHSSHQASFAVPQWLNPRGHFVYIVWGENVLVENGEDYDVLYVGVSSKILHRIAQHALDSLWWEHAERIDLFEYATRDAADEVERWWIARYGPLYNVNGRGDQVGVPLEEWLRSKREPSA